MVGPHSVGPAPLSPVRDVVGISGLAVPREEEIFVDAVILLGGIYFLQFVMRVELSVQPEFDIFEVGRPRPQSFGHGFGAYRRVPADASIVDPVSGFHHFRNLLGGPFLSRIFC